MKNVYPILPALLIFPLGAVFVHSPFEKLALSTVGLLFLLKLGALLRSALRSESLPSGWGWPAFLFGWPGLRPESFSRRENPPGEMGWIFVEGFAFSLAGGILQLALFEFGQNLPESVRFYLGLASILLTVHFGFSSILYVFYRFFGWPVEPLFRSPLKAASLKEFWGSRWNLAFVDMDRRMIFPLLPKNRAVAVFLIFIISGCLHELAISYPAGAAWGGPLTYFAVQGLLVAVESRVNRCHRLLTWIALLLPLPWLFPLPFLRLFVEPYLSVGHTLVASLTLYWALIICGVGHFLILVASFQVPARLNWKLDFARLSRFNQKIFWTYGGYIVFCIVAFGLVDILNGKALVEVNSSALSIALFIAIFWTVRVIVDFGYFRHDDWPKGDQFVIGHACLTALFCMLASVHWAVVIHQLG